MRLCVSFCVFFFLVHACGSFMFVCLLLRVVYLCPVASFGGLVCWPHSFAAQAWGAGPSLCICSHVLWITAVWEGPEPEPCAAP